MRYRRKGTIFLVFMFAVISTGFYFSDTGLDLFEQDLEESPPIVVIFTESTRADHVGPCYGYERETMPNVCDLAEDGVLFENAHSQGSWTPAAMGSFFTSRSPNQAGLPDWAWHLSFEADTFTEELSDVGYTVREGDGQDHLAEPGLLQGFDGDTDMDVSGDMFMGFHFYANHAHWPYLPDEEFRKWDNISRDYQGLRELWDTEEFENRTAPIQDFVDLYNGDMRQGDNATGEVIEDLKEKGIYEDALIVYTSDHGQRFGEEPYLKLSGTHQEPVAQHEDAADPALTHVPLVIKFPDNKYAGEVVEEPVRLMDVGTTILEYTGIEDGFGIGKSLIPLLEGEEQEREIFSAFHFGIDNPQFTASLIEEDKVFQIDGVKRACSGEVSDPRTVLYEREETPENPYIEEDIGDRIEDYSDEENLHDRLCEAYTRGGEQEYFYLPEDDGMSEEMEEQLRALGYID